MRRLSLIALATALLGCGPSLPRDLGGVDADKVTLQSSTVLSYLQQALDRDDDLTVKQLFEEELHFASAPNPTELFATRHAEALDAEVPANPQSLTVLTYNVGLLDRAKILGFIDRVAVPEIQPRREAAPDLLLKRGYDVLLLQEVWEPADVDRFVLAAQQYGYKLYAGSEQEHAAHGLVILVREALIGDGAEDKLEVTYEVQYDLENFPGPGMRRGFLMWRFTTADGVPLRLYNTHLTAFEEHWRVRMAQSRELGLHVAAAPQEEVIIVGGDLNASPYYHRDAWEWPDGTKPGGWWHNTISYPLLLHYSGLRDLLAETRPAQDVALGADIPNNPDSAATVPYGDASYCERTGHLAFTATDCNSLHFRGYPGQGPAHRIDYLLFRSAQLDVYTANVQIAFTERLVFDGYGTFELSDHYGVLADLRIDRP